MKDQHDELLMEWANTPHHLDKGFIWDGIICPERWDNIPRKILFINKEAYDGTEPDPDGFDLRSAIRSWGGPRGKTYGAVAALAFGLHRASIDRLAQFPRWDTTPYESFREPLLASAVMNIKKSGGKSSSDTHDLESYVKRDGHYIRRQVDIINPHIIICGAIWHLIKHLWPDATEIYDSVFVADGRTCIAFWHPANRADEQMKYYAFAALVQNADVLKRYRSS
jgi:hypothetical protein